MTINQMRDHIYLPSVGGTECSWPGVLANSRYTVVVFMSVQCPYALAYFSDLAQLSQCFQRDAIQFILINSNRTLEEEPETLEEMARRFPSLPMPFVRDEEGAVARLLGAVATPHAFVLDSASRVHWSGPIDMRFRPPNEWAEGASGPWPWDEELPTPPEKGELRTALEALLEGVLSENQALPPVGCSIKL